MRFATLDAGRPIRRRAAAGCRGGFSGRWFSRGDRRRGFCGIAVFARWRYRRMLGFPGLSQTSTNWSATLTARQALAMPPGDPQAVGLLAAITTQTGSPKAMLWLEHLAALRPGESGHVRTSHKRRWRRGTPALALGSAPAFRPRIRIPPPATQWPGAYDFICKTIGPQRRSTFPPRRNSTAIRRSRGSNSPRLIARPDAPARRKPRGMNRRAPSRRMQLPACAASSANARAFRWGRRQKKRPGNAVGASSNDGGPLGSARSNRRRISSSRIEAGTRCPARPRREPMPLPDATLARWMKPTGCEQASAWIDALPPNLRAAPMLLLVRTESRAAPRAIGNDVRARTNDEDAARPGRPLSFLRLAYGLGLVEFNRGRRGPDFAGRWERARQFDKLGASAALSIWRGSPAWDWKAEACEIWWLLAPGPPARARP